jgi:hypothetical protein
VAGAADSARRPSGHHGGQHRADQAAGEAEIAGHCGHCIGLEIDGQSGHVFVKGWDAREIGEDFFAAAGISFP